MFKFDWLCRLADTYYLLEYVGIENLYVLNCTYIGISTSQFLVWKMVTENRDTKHEMAGQNLMLGSYWHKKDFFQFL